MKKDKKNNIKNNYKIKEKKIWKNEIKNKRINFQF
jgi:hypothetical protein